MINRDIIMTQVESCESRESHARSGCVRLEGNFKSERAFTMHFITEKEFLYYII